MDGLSQPALLDVAPKRRKPAMLFCPKEYKLVFRVHGLLDGNPGQNRRGNEEGRMSNAE
jgi:hypothetical protein